MGLQTRAPTSPPAHIRPIAWPKSDTVSLGRLPGKGTDIWMNLERHPASLPLKCTSLESRPRYYLINHIMEDQQTQTTSQFLSMSVRLPGLASSTSIKQAFPVWTSTFELRGEAALVLHGVTNLHYLENRKRARSFAVSPALLDI